MNLIDLARQYISRRRTAYVRVFDGPFGDEVLADLAKFCRANDTAFHADPRVHAALEGRREVFLRIARHLNLTDEQLWALHAPATKGTTE
jgi:hypothetical protein